MSALDDIIARDAGGGQQSALDAIIARDAGSSTQQDAPQTASAGLSGAPVAPQGATPQQPGSFLMGLGDAVKGGVQGIVHGVSYAADKIAPNSQFAKDFHSGAQQVDQTIQNQNQAYEAARAATGAGTDWGRLAGNVVGTAPTMLMNPEMGGAGLLARTGVGALQGAAGASLMPVNDVSQGYGQQKLADALIGGGIGAAAPVLGSAARTAGQNIAGALQPVISPGKYVGQGLARAMAPQDAAAVANSIRNAPTFVPGSTPTTAQVGGTPLLVQTEKALANTSPDFKGDLTQLQNNNNAARLGVISGIAGTPGDLATAQAQRAAATQPLYDAAHRAQVNVGPAFDRFAQIPEVQQAMAAGNANAQLDAAAGRGVAPVWPSGQSRAINGAALDYTSRALGDMINQAKSGGANSKAASLTALKSQIDGFAQNYIPGVQQARAAYAQASVPVSTMQAGQQIEDAFANRPLDANKNPIVTLTGFNSALAKSIKAQKYGIDPVAQTQLGNVASDLQRESVSNSIKSPGADTAYNLAANGWLARNLYGPSFGGATSTGKTAAALATALTGHPIAAAGVFAGGNKVGQAVGQRLQSQLANLLLNPDALLPHLDAHAATAAGNATPNPLVQGLLQYGRPALVNGSAAALINSP
ncbi:hypothetical protein WM40_22710 [Robbsia andropogonis]|uniref:Uncharacterized protein n=1 Tax=Robbsia andropogonis TaxID=28092 RepID=A0A0F5JUN2_9BURK|nr:hypothetical protein [Robbsia andropogonis]KKB61553.1 hypothetical protein WM40_22710 [Robbsia andropogonis]